MERNIEIRLTTGLQRVTLFFYFISESVIYFMKLIFWYIMERKHAVGNVGKTGFKKRKQGEKISKSGQVKQTKAKNKGGRGATKKPTSPNQLQQQVKRGKVPKGISRVDSSDPNIPNSQPHIHFGENESALNLDGTRHDAGKERPNITNKIKEWILDNGWNLPVE